MSNKYKEFSRLDLPEIEKNILEKWAAEKAFEKSIERRKDATAFVFYEGPPSANGMPGIHHVISRTIKDMVCRYKTMRGFKVNRKAGWDTHGLPVELGIEKELGITKEDIGTKISVEAYNQKCREAVLKYKKEWDELTTKMGYWVDLNNPYITYENNYIETLWWLLKKLFDRDLLYESISIQPYSPAAGTGLSSHELNQPGTYKNVKDTSATVLFKAKRNEKSNFLFEKANQEDIFFIAWTTTPWTLPSNLGLAVGSSVKYALVKTFNPYTFESQNVIIAADLLNKYFNKDSENIINETFTNESKNVPWQIIAEFEGKDLEHVQYEQLLAFDANKTSNTNAFQVMLGDFVTTEDGTGIVHIAPAFGADDFKIGQKYDIGILTMVDKEGKFIQGMGEYSGRYVKNYRDTTDYQDVNVDISIKLKKEGRAFKVEKYDHSYPHCWRTDKPILYYPLKAWFIKTTARKERMVELNNTITWKPQSTGEGRFGNWLENMVDWNLSRSRFWGTPLPVWRSEDGEEKCVGSIQELTQEYKKAKKAGIHSGKDFEIKNGELQIDLHKPYVDELILISDSQKPMHRVSALIDVWFDSGAMPFAQWHFPFENIEKFAENYPADLICEGVDQTRGWFYTLHAISALVKEDIHAELSKHGIEVSDKKYPGIAYKTVISNGLVLDKYGNKMSKRLGNTVDPFETINQYGADSTRWYLMTNASPWDNLKFDIEGIKEVQRKFFGTLYNTYQFFALYANLDHFSYSEKNIPLAQRPEMDQWILSCLHSLIKVVSENMDIYEPTSAYRAIDDFVDNQLSNWYVRLCRRRFWKGEYEEDKISAYQTLYTCLETICRLIAPVSPFFSDSLFRNLNKVTQHFDLQSVHHADFPSIQKEYINRDLEERMQLAQDISSLILSLRKKENIIVRQPLQKALIPVSNTHTRHHLELAEEIIKSETNIKEIEYVTESDTVISKKVKADFKVLGKRLGNKMKEAAARISAMTQQEIALLEKEETFSFNLDGEETIITPEDVIITAEDIPGWSVATRGSLTVALDIKLTSALKEEGVARMFINRVQNLRKEKKYELTDRIFVKILDNEALSASIMKYKEYICAEILADELLVVNSLPEYDQIEIDNKPVKIHIHKL